MVEPIADAFRKSRLEVAQSSRDANHFELMRTSNAVLLFRAAHPNPDEWLNHSVLELLAPASALGRQTDFAAKALLVRMPERIRERVRGVPIFDYTESFDPRTLEPFLAEIGRE